MVEKNVNVEPKASLQSLSKTKEINSRYPKNYRLIAKKDKDDITGEHRNGDKVNSHNFSPTNTTQP